MHGNHEPQGRVDRVVLGSLARVGEAVGQHAARFGAGPGVEDVTRELDPARDGEQAAERDEGVPAPVREPGIPCENGPPAAAADDVGVGRPVQRRGEALPACCLGLEQPPPVDLGRGRQPVALTFTGTQDHEGIARREIEGEGAGRGEVLDIVEAALPFLLVEEVAVPEGLVPVAAIVQHGDRRQARIRTPQHPRLTHLRLEPEARVLVMQAVIVPARQQRPDHEAHVTAAAHEPPAQDDLAALVAGDDLLRDLGAVLGPERPGRPRLGVEAGDPRMAVGMHHVRRVALGAQREAAPGRLDPGLDAVDQHDPAGRRGGGRQEQRVVAPCAHPGDGAGGEAALPVGLEPFCVRRITDAPRRHGVAPFWFQHPHRVPPRLSMPLSAMGSPPHAEMPNSP